VICHLNLKSIPAPNRLPVVPSSHCFTTGRGQQSVGSQV
jgi:hypothetical protein